MKHLIAALAVAVLCLAGAEAPAEEPGTARPVTTTTTGGGEIMTNEKIISLVKAGLSEQFVIRMIQRSPRTQLDVTTGGVLKLIDAGVSEEIVTVMRDIWEKQEEINNRNIRNFIQILRCERDEDYDRAVRELVAYGAFATPPLIENLRAEDERIRAGCCDVLGQVADPPALEPLFRMLYDRHKAVRAKAARAISMFSDERIAAGIKQRLASAIDRRGRPRDGLALAIGYIGDLEQLPSLLHVASDPGPETDRAAAAYSLGLLGEASPEVLRVLKRAVLSATFREYREASARALGRLSVQMDRRARLDVTRALVTAMKRLPVSRDILALQLRHFPTRISVEALLDQLGDRNKEVSGASWEALKVITGETHHQDVEAWRSWWEIAQIGPRWREEPGLTAVQEKRFEFKPEPDPEIPDYLRLEDLAPEEDRPPEEPEKRPPDNE